MVRKFIIDTDTGVDDAMALLMALDAHLKHEVISGRKISRMSSNLLPRLRSWRSQPSMATPMRPMPKSIS